MSERLIIVQSRANKVIDLADRKITVTSSATIWENPAGGRVEDVFIAVELSGSRDHKFEFHLWSFPHMFLHETPEGWQKAADKLAQEGLQAFVNLIVASLKPDPYQTITQKMLEAFVQPEFSTSEELYWLCEVGKAADALWWIKFMLSMPSPTTASTWMTSFQSFNPTNLSSTSETFRSLDQFQCHERRKQLAHPQAFLQRLFPFRIFYVKLVANQSGWRHLEKRKRGTATILREG